MNVLSELLGTEIAEGKLSEFSDFLSEKFPFGKYLVLTDEKNAPALTDALRTLQKRMTLVLSPSDDVLPLFSAPDGVTCVVGAGGVVPAARYFACARSLPFVAVAASSSPEGLGGRLVSVRAGGKQAVYPVPPPSAIYFDPDLQKGDEEGISSARAFLAACAVDLFGFTACRKLKFPAAETVSEDIVSLFSAAASVAFADSPTDRLFFATLTAEYCFFEGFPKGEAFALAGIFDPDRLYESSLFSSALALSEVYELFFSSGYCREKGVDYNARYRRALALTKTLSDPAASRPILSAPPSAERLAEYSRCFGREREELCSQMKELREKLKKLSSELGGEKIGSAERARLGALLGSLPELLSPRYALTSLMRDFCML